MDHGHFLGAEGKCFSFDHRAEGYARSEGVGTIFMKPLSAAVKNHDTIRAIIHGTGVNHDGRTPGISLPDEVTQERLIRGTYRLAGLDPKDIMFVESHGTGTIAGDVIESKAIVNAFNSAERSLPLYVGAIKSGIGHLESAAGIAGIIKSILVLESGIIPPNVNLEKVNPDIKAKELNLSFPTKCVAWPALGAR
jgi:acyl transferase domain-containing protein